MLADQRKRITLQGRGSSSRDFIDDIGRALQLWPGSAQEGSLWIAE